MKDERQGLEAMLEIMREHDLDAVTVRSNDQTYELVLRGDATPAAAPVPVEPTHAQPTATGPVAGTNYKKVTAPIIGVFYRAPAPGAEDFVQVGDRVEVGQALCILEAMKLMNEITSDYAGVVQRILPDNGALVSLGEEMFWIEP
jgi:acetyl-CoA carboxylase biotin carboxyl carrier protein